MAVHKSYLTSTALYDIIVYAMVNQPPLILVVDDEPYFREIFSKKLTAEGFRVEVAQDGEEAIRKAKQLKFDLILMDVKMPGIDGVEAMLAIKEDPSTKSTRVLFLTSAGEPRSNGGMEHNADYRAAEDLGAVGYLRKTDDLMGIVEKIKSFV